MQYETCTSRAEGVTTGDRAAFGIQSIRIDTADRRIQTELRARVLRAIPGRLAREHLCREGFVQLELLEVLHFHLPARQQLRDRVHRAETHFTPLDACRQPAVTWQRMGVLIRARDAEAMGGDFGSLTQREIDVRIGRTERERIDGTQIRGPKTHERT